MFSQIFLGAALAARYRKRDSSELIVVHQPLYFAGFYLWDLGVTGTSSFSLASHQQFSKPVTVSSMVVSHSVLKKNAYKEQSAHKMAIQICNEDTKQLEHLTLASPKVQRVVVDP